jgi:hypothetical protein
VRFRVDNQLHFIDSQGYHAVNLYTGADIWNAGTADALMFYEEDLFLLDGSSNLSRISSADNVSAPVSVITLEPELPNPDSGWYTSAPRFSIAASDRESYAESTYFRIDEADWQAGAAGELPQGVHRLEYYSVDNQGLSEATNMRLFRVDSVAPQALISIEAPAGDNGWYTGPARISLDASDLEPGSGLKETYFRINDQAFLSYSSPVVISDNGETLFTWYASDTAGNSQEHQQRSIRIDGQAPIIGHDLEIGDGFALLYLNADDDVNGTEKIEYRIDGESVEEYGEAMYFSMPGDYRVSYWAYDGAGNRSADQSLSFTVPERSRFPLLREVYWGYGDRFDGSYRSDIREGQAAYYDRADDRKIQNLPAGLEGSESLLLSRDDFQRPADPWLSIRFLRGAYVHVLSPPGAVLIGEDPSRHFSEDWELVASDLPSPVSGESDGWSHYRRRVLPGERTHLAFENAQGPAPLIIAHPVEIQWIGITNPRQRGILVPGEAYELDAKVVSFGRGGEPEYELLWEVAGEDGVWEAHTEESLVIPYVEDRGQLNLRVSAFGTDGRLLGRTDAEYIVLNRAEVRILSPDPRRSLYYGSYYPFRLMFGMQRGDCSPPAKPKSWPGSTAGNGKRLPSAGADSSAHPSVARPGRSASTLKTYRGMPAARPSASTSDPDIGTPTEGGMMTEMTMMTMMTTTITMHPAAAAMRGTDP